MIFVSKRAVEMPVASRFQRPRQKLRRTSPGLARAATRAVLIVCSCVAFSAVAHSAPVSLAELEQHSLRARDSVAAGTARIDAASARISASRAAQRPTLGLGVQAEAAPGNRLVRVLDAAGDEYLVAGSRSLGDSGALTPEARYGAMLSLESQLYDFGRSASSIRAAQAEHRAAQVGVDAERQQVVREVRRSYAAWILAHGTRDILRENIESLSALRLSIEGRVAAGALPGAEVAPARYEETRAALELAQAEQRVELARLALSRASARPLGPDATPDFALLDNLPQVAPRTTDSSAMALERQRDSALAAASAHRSAHSPVLSAKADAGVRGQLDQVFPVYRVGIVLEVPLLDGGVSQAAEQLATARATELSAQARDANAQAAFEQARALAEQKAAAARVLLAQQLLDAAQASHRHAVDQGELGSGGLAELVRAEARVATSKLELLAARVARANAALLLAAVNVEPRSASR